MASPSSSWLAAVAGGVLLLASCGMPGAPQPPTLDLPRPVSDLRAVRKGDRVTLQWTQPRDTTDRQRIRRPGPTQVCRSVDVFPMLECAQISAELPPQEEVAPAAPATFTDVIPAEVQRRQPLGSAGYALMVQNARGHSAGLSNQVRVPLAPTLAPPADLRAGMSPEGIVLTWTGHPHTPEHPALGHVYRLYRRSAEAPTPVPVGEVRLDVSPEARHLDRTFQWEHSYEYVVTVVTTITRDGQVVDEVEGEDSDPVRITARDIFPPEIPSGMQAVAVEAAGRIFIDLTWAPNVEADLGGYHVYRRVEGREPVRLTVEAVRAPAFRDEQVERGVRYLYSASAVDLRGNESRRSPEAAETIPAEALRP